MHCTVDEAQERISSFRFSQWIAYHQVEPHGYEMDNWRMGSMASSIVNAIYASIPIPKGAKRPKPLTPKDFYPAVAKPSADLTPEQAEYIRKKHGKRGNSHS